MSLRKMTIGGGLVVLTVVVASLTGCGNCHDEMLDRVEQRLQDDPERSGKVGTYRALQVAQTARQTTDERARRGEGPCAIGWRLDESFQIDFDFEVTVEAPDDDAGRKWSEEGRWRRDDDGRWEIEIDAEFVDGPEVEGQRRFRVFRDDEGFWEWLGPEVVARHGPKTAIERGWRREFGGRFAGLARLVSTTWQSDDADASRWVPGGERLLCGPVDDAEAIEPWRPLFEARSSRRSAAISPETDDGRNCRRLEASYDPGGDHSMIVDYRECLETGPKRLDRPDAKRVVDAERDRERLRVSRQLEQWLESGLVDAYEE